MANPKGNVNNLHPVRSKEEAIKKGRKGGKKSGKVRREKKLMSQIYADILAEQTGKQKGLSLKAVVKAVLMDGGAPAVSMLKEIRESTEGQNINFNGESISIILNPVKVQNAD